MVKKKNKTFSIFYFLFGLIFFIPSPSYADCDLGWGNGTRPVGTVVFNTNCDVMQVCRSDNQWHALGPFTPGCGDNSPDAFSFTDQTDVAVSTPILSNIETITGITGSVSVSISGDGTPDFRIDGGSWITAGTITNGQTLQLRLTSNAANSTMNSATVTVGTGSDQWDVTTAGADPCAGSPSPGDTCADGSYYIGQVASNDIYATAAASQSTETWNNGTTNWTVTGFTSTTDGPGNTAGLVASGDAGAPYDAAVYCNGLTNVHGFSDWYLPAKDELNLFWNGGSPVAGVLTDGTFYLASTEGSASDAWVQRFTDGSQFSTGQKANTWAVRCVRRN